MGARGPGKTKLLDEPDVYSDPGLGGDQVIRLLTNARKNIDLAVDAVLRGDSYEIERCLNEAMIEIRTALNTKPIERKVSE